MKIAQEKMKFFARFARFDSSGSWSCGPNSWDAIILVASKAVTIKGVGIFEPHPDGGDFTLFYKWQVKDAAGTIISSSP